MNQPSSKIKSSTSPVYVQLLTGVSSFASGFLSVYAPQRGKLHETMLQPRNFFLSKNFFAESLDNSMPEWYSNHCRTAAGVVELVDTGDLKSPGSDTVPVRVRSPAPSSYRGVEQLVARRAHNPEVAGSSPVSATRKSTAIQWIAVLFLHFSRENPRHPLGRITCLAHVWHTEQSRALLVFSFQQRLRNAFRETGICLLQNMSAKIQGAAVRGQQALANSGMSFCCFETIPEPDTPGLY